MIPPATILLPNCSARDRIGQHQADRRDSIEAVFSVLSERSSTRCHRYCRTPKPGVGVRVPPLLPSLVPTSEISGFFVRFGNASRAVASFCSRYGRHALPRHALLIGGPGIAFDLPQSGMPADRGDDIGGASGFGQTPASGLTESVGAAMLRQSCLITASLKPATKARSRKRLTIFSDQEG